MEEYYMALKNRITPRECAEYIDDIFSDKLKIQVTNKSYEDRIIVGCDYMSLTIYEELEKEDYDFYQEEYGLCITTEIWLQLLGRTIEKGIEITFMLLNDIIHNKNLCEDFIFRDIDGWVVLGKTGDCFYTQMRQGIGIDMGFPFELIEGNVIRDKSNPLSNELEEERIRQEKQKSPKI